MLKAPLATSQPQRVALVTGASKGIGEALCRRLTSQGWTVIGIARSTERLKMLQSRLGKERFLPYTCDVAHADRVAAVSADLKEKGITPSLFFLNAGVAGEAAFEPVDHLDRAQHRTIFNVNYHGVLHWVAEWESSCLNSGGATFMVTSSVQAFFSPPGGSAYSASKAAISKTFEGLRLCHLDDNLDFLVVYPGPVATDGLTGKVPFTWSADRMAKYMIAKAAKKKAHCEPTLYYSAVMRLLHWLPTRVTMKILESFKPKD